MLEKKSPLIVKAMEQEDFETTLRENSKAQLAFMQNTQGFFHVFRSPYTQEIKMTVLHLQYIYNHTSKHLRKDSRT